MKVSNIGNTRVSFGYNAQLNRELINKLDTYPDKAWARTLYDLNRSCNNVEDNLRREVAQEPQNQSRIEDYLDILATQKSALVGFTSVTFPDFNFADVEYNTYLNEVRSEGNDDEDDWRLEVCSAISPFLSSADEPLTDEQKADLHKVISSVNQPVETASVSVPSDAKIPNIVSTGKVPPSTIKLKSDSKLKIFSPTDESPKGFKDVAGMDDLKDKLLNSIVYMVKNPDQAKLDFEEYGKKMPNGVLMYGPPGCGKTYIAQALAAEIDSPLYLLSIGKVGSAYINTTSKNIEAAFSEITDIAKQSDRPVVLFLDEFDSLGFKREEDRTSDEDVKQIDTFLQAIDSAKDSGVIIIAATNKYDMLDPAIKRRFKEKAFVSVPNKEARQALIVKTLSNMTKAKSLLLDGEKLTKIASMLDGFSSDSVCKISLDAASNALKRDRADIDIIDFDVVISKTEEEKPDLNLYKAKNKGSKTRIGFV